jgi:hypothetical protein
MNSAKAIGIAATLGLLSACVTTRDRLSSSADRLEHDATRMAENARYQPAGAPFPPVYGRDALNLATDASQLSNVVHEHANDAEVSAIFARVASDYDAVSAAVEHSPNPQAHSDMAPISAAYREVERQFGKPLHQARDQMRQAAADAL